MGVGKGRIGRELAKNLGVFALDCDDLIQSANNAKIKEKSGNFFRKERKKCRNFNRWGILPRPKFEKNRQNNLFKKRF